MSNEAISEDADWEKEVAKAATVRRVLNWYRKALADFLRALATHARIKDRDRLQVEDRRADSFYADTYVPAMEHALAAAICLLAQVEGYVPTFTEAMNEAWECRLGEFRNIDDPEMDLESRQVLNRYRGLYLAFPILGVTV